MEWPAWAVQAWAAARPWVERLEFWRGYEQEFQTLLLIGVGIAVYTALVFTFYSNVSRRGFVKFTPRPGVAGRMLRFAESVLVIPAISIAYFGVLAAALFLLAKPTQPTQTILLVAASVVVGVRMTAILAEQMSSDLSKLVPLGLLGVLLVDPGYLTFQTIWGRLTDSWFLLPLIARLVALFVVMEASLQAARGLYHKAQDVRARRAKRRPSRAQLIANAEKTRTVPVGGPSAVETDAGEAKP